MEKITIQEFLNRYHKIVDLKDMGKKDVHCRFCGKTIFDGEYLDFCGCAEAEEALIPQPEPDKKAALGYAYRDNLNKSKFEGAEKKSTFQNFKAHNPQLEEAVKACKEYAKGNIISLIIAGSVGTGKTHLACATAKFISYYEEKTIQIIRCSTVSQNDMEDAKAVDVLVVDDIGRELGASEKAKTRISIISEIIEYRYRNGLKTIYTTNLKAQELIDKYGSHIIDRILESCKYVGFLEFDSYRPKIGGQ